MLEIKNLHASIAGKEILKGLNLTIHEGEVHAIMGPNGAGKSTLSNVLTGHPAYTVTEGEVIFRGKNLLEMAPGWCTRAKPLCLPLRRRWKISWRISRCTRKFHDSVQVHQSFFHQREKLW